MSGFGDYLERNYDSGREEEQVQADRMRAQEIEAEIEKKKSRMKSQVIDQVAKEKGISKVSDDKIEEFYNEYVNKEEEYLVDGAILQCNQATYLDFPVLGGDPVVLEGEFNRKQAPHTTLRVYENPIYSNGLIFATVGDTIKGTNIIPFKCNCKIEADRESEIEKIKNDKSCSKHGVCRHLMQLNSEWENVSLGESSYLSRKDISGSVQVPNNYLQQVRYGIVKNSSIVVEKEGLNMCSILFCKHGGIITPVHSGQKSNEIKRKYYTKEDVEHDIANGLYTAEDFYYLVAIVSHEADSYEGMVAVAYEILNRREQLRKSIKDNVTNKSQYRKYNSNRLNVMLEDEAESAAVAALRGEVFNPIGDIINHFGRVDGYDIWFEDDTCEKVIVISNEDESYRNVFYSPYGTVHNKVINKTKDAVVLYDHVNGKWLCEEGVTVIKDVE